MDKLLLGRYIQGDSLVHRLDPRAKMILCFYFVLIIFLCNNWQSYLLLGIVTLLSVLLSKIDLSYFVKGVMPLIWLILFTVLLQVFFTRGGPTYWQFGPLTLTQFGLVNGLTTTPLAIADATESLMQPLKKLRVPVHEIALMLSIALRFVPTLMDETTKIMNAQRSRGVDFSEGSLISRIKAVIPLLIPLFVSALTRAEDLATAMEARGYRGEEGRSKYRVRVWHLQDTLALVFFFLVTLALIFLRN